MGADCVPSVFEWSICICPGSRSDVTERHEVRVRPHVWWARLCAIDAATGKGIIVTAGQ
jgi:hypothetical protein